MKRVVEEGRDEEVRELLREVAPMNSSFELRNLLPCRGAEDCDGRGREEMVRIVVRKEGDEGREERG